MNQDIQKIISQAKQRFEPADLENDTSVIKIYPGLYTLLHEENWKDEQIEFFNGWLKKLDIAKTHYQQYQTNWKLTDNKDQVNEVYYELSLLLVLQRLEALKAQQAPAPHLLKIINVAFKVLDYLGSDSLTDKNLIQAYLVDSLDGLNINPVEQVTTVESKPLDQKTLPVTVLFWEGPIARAYLETIRSMGLKVKKIIKLVSSVDLIRKKPVGKFLPYSMRANYAANKQYKQIFYWPNFYQSKNTETVQSIQDQVGQNFGFMQSTLKNAVKNLDLQIYTEQLETCCVTGLRDTTLAAQLTAEDSELFLFTGGGIVPTELLSMPDKQMIHIHPGFLPEIRGADCVLWSQLTAKRLSASAFFLAPGIDVGDIIHPAWLPDIQLKFPETFDSRVKYRMIYGFLDPWVRSYVLMQVIEKTKGFKKITVRAQHETEGMTFHFMHQSMMNHVFDEWQSLDG